MTDTCQNCRFWDGRKSDIGHCHRNAPAFVQGEGRGRFPITSYDTWCGEFSQRPSEEIPFTPGAWKDRDISDVKVTEVSPRFRVTYPFGYFRIEEIKGVT